MLKEEVSGLSGGRIRIFTNTGEDFNDVSIKRETEDFIEIKPYDATDTDPTVSPRMRAIIFKKNITTIITADLRRKVILRNLLAKLEALGPSL